MRRIQLTLLALLTAVAGLWAQTEDRGHQILVFRNTGEVNLFYSNELDSITTNETSQIFYTADTTLVVPHAELDSVAVGNRNEMKFYNGVKELTKDEDLPWIIRFDGQAIFYRLNTPAHILPSVWMKLFYGLEDNLTEDSLFPYGLSVKVVSVTKLTDEICVEVKLVELNEIFERLFLAGSFTSSIAHPEASRHNGRRAPVHTTLGLGHTISMNDIGSLSVNGNLEINGDAVISLNPFRNYSHADLIISYGFDTNVTLEAQENATYHYEELGPNRCIGTFYKLLNLEAAVGAFADMSAELNLGVELQRTYKRRLIWTRRGGENTFAFKEANAKEPYEDNAKIDLTLKGDLFFGPMLKIDFVTIGDLIGARAKVKIGPKIEGTINMGMIQQMHDYQSQFYGDAKLNLCSQVALEGFVTNRQNIVWGEVVEHPVFNISIPFGEHEWSLFPQYNRSRAVAETNSMKQTEMTMATTVSQPAPRPVETGFELVDAEGEVVDSIFVGTIEVQKESTKEQLFNAERTLPKEIQVETLDQYKVRPVFHYAGYTVSAEPVSISKDVNLQLYTATQSNGAMTFISSGPFLGSVKHNETLYTLGAYLPVPPKKLKDDDTPVPIVPGIDITYEKSDLLCGKWSGTMDDKEMVLVLEEGDTGSLTTEGQAPRKFTYKLNTPQTGELLIMFEDESDNLLLLVLSVNETTLRVINKRDSTMSIITFQRQ